MCFIDHNIGIGISIIHIIVLRNDTTNIILWKIDRDMVDDNIKLYQLFEVIKL